MSAHDAGSLASLQSRAHDRVVSEDAVRQSLMVPGFSPEQDGRVLSLDARDVGAVRVLVDEREAIIAWTLEPGSEGAVAEPLLLWALERCREISGIRTVRTNVDGGSRAATATAERLGFLHVSSTLTMSHRALGSVPPPEWPGGVAARRVDPDQVVDSVMELHIGSFQDQPDFERPERDSWERWLERHGPESVLFAGSADEIMSFCIATVFSPGLEGYIGPIGTLPRHRRKGIGRALLREALHSLAERGCGSVRLVVDSSNPASAARLYVSEGFEVISDWRTYEKSL